MTGSGGAGSLRVAKIGGRSAALGTLGTLGQVGTLGSG